MNPRRSIFFACIACFALAASAAPAPQVTTTLGGDRFVAGGSVRQSDAVKGDLIAAGGQLDLESPVQGDLVGAGGSVSVRERVGQGVYAAGGRVLIDAPVARNVRAAGGHVEIGSKATIDGNLSAAGGDLAIRGPVKGYAQLAGGEVLIDAPIDGDVVASCGKLTLGPNARIGGSLRYRAGEEITRDPAAQVAGNIERLASRRDGTHRTPASRWARGWLWTAGVALLAVIVAGALPAAGRRVGGELRAHPWISLAAGFVLLVCIPVAALVLMVTIIGIPVALLALLVYFALLIVGYVATAVTLGDAALARARPAAPPNAGWRMGAALLAVLVLAILARIPFIGGLVVLAAIVLGIGALFLAIKPAAPAAAA